ncbi:MAG: NUDIX hydrolase [Polyangiaceae bacterium]
MLPPLPPLQLVLIEDRIVGGEGGFMQLRRTRLAVAGAGGAQSKPFVYDTLQRSRLDAVVIAAHFRDPGGARRVFLRSALRPPIFLRPAAARPVPEKETLGGLWELPAGLVEEDERSAEGLRQCAARELAEELGITVPAERMAQLGPSTFPSPGIIGERHFFFHVEVDPTTRGVPSEDGSVLEQGAVVTDVAVEEALALARRGEIEDAKTELALRRLAELA